MKDKSISFSRYDNTDPLKKLNIYKDKKSCVKY